MHFVTACSLNLTERTFLYDKIARKFAELDKLNDMGKFVLLFTFKDAQMLTWFGEFLYKSFTINAFQWNGNVIWWWSAIHVYMRTKTEERCSWRPQGWGLSVQHSTTICKLVDLIPAPPQSDCRIPNWISGKTVLSSSTNHGQITARFRSFFQ